MPRRDTRLDFAAMSAQAREYSCPQCTRCRQRWTANAGGVCTRCLKAIAFKREQAKKQKRRPKPTDPVRTVKCCRCCEVEVSGQESACPACLLDIADIKAKIRAGLIVVPSLFDARVHG